MIEHAIEALTLAVNRNTDALNAILAKAGAYPQAEPAAEPKPARAKKAQPVEAEVVAPVNPPEPEPEPATEPTPDQTDNTPEPEPGPEPATEPEATQTLSRDEWVAKITRHVKDVYTASGPNLTAKKAAFEAMRGRYGISRVQELADDKFAPFWADVQAL